MHSVFLTYKSSLIHYRKGKEGKQLLFCFHGYGESSESFDFLETSTDREFTLIAIDLPFHGKTDWQEGLFLDPRDLLVLLEKISGGLPGGNQQWLLMGFSMGGRVALDLLQMAPEKIEKMVLLAPDGLKLNGWYWLATQTGPGNWLFRLTMQNPAWLFFVLRIAHRSSLLNQSIYKFTVNYIDNTEVRDELYKRWTTLRGFRPDIPALRSSIRQHQVSIRLLYGRYDRIIRSTTGEKFRKGIETYCSLVILPGGHQILQPKYLEELLASLKK
jgi:pimeloyl-ACP methyl ester carboxylesterase